MVNGQYSERESGLELLMPGLKNRPSSVYSPRLSAFSVCARACIVSEMNFVYSYASCERAGSFFQD